MVSPVTPFTDFHPSFKPLTHTTPFTFTGYAFLEMYEELVQYLTNTLSEEINTNLDLIYEQTQTAVNGLAADIATTKEQWQALFDAFVGNIVVELEGLNDQAVANLIANKNSLMRKALDLVIDEARRVKVTQQFYVSTTGSDTNDGLTPGSPRATANKIIADTQNAFYAAGVEVIINFAAGTYTENVRFENMTGEIKTYRLRGQQVDHPATPTVIFSRGLGDTSSAFIVRNPALDLIVEYIKFIGYDGNASAGGIVMADGRLTTNNVHAERCYWGITASRGNINVPNGVFHNNGRINGLTGSGAGIRSLMLTNHSIGNQYGSTGSSTIFTGNTYGFLAQESSVGHVDYCTFDGNDYGLVARVNSRANAGGSIFRNNVTAITSTGNSYVLISGDTFTAEPNSNGTNIVARLGGVVSLSTFDAYVGDVDISMSIAPRRVVGVYDRIQHTGASDYIFDRLLKAGFWNDNSSTRRPAKKVQLHVRGTVSGTTASKTLGVRLGVTANAASVSANIPANVTGAIDMVFDLVMRAPSDQYMNMRTIVGDTTITSDAVSTVDMSSDRQLRVSLSTSSATDIFVINAIELYIEG